VYLKSKKRKADRANSYYIVEEGDSMHSISQKYGVKMKSLYKMNNKKGDYMPEVGDRIRLR
ncbi:MAG: LysM domain-containing protein, partial [Bacteroides sp.]|nr:LysM domain-containing protein [Bacteroides sp.]